ncbi:hypothetical protein D3P07_01075 [Paenibacillus sp. 1011MAR3C5]|uniref:hypothetical protein n=1 Tax=Paenibacillus sp. 1011MAR3C5 TaxID=1675787 RepID=UPI000E6BC5FA|nr:hypothetical protein [Paenibacillus sp. 1011MAR3C5]RJE90728.1 hypothetical protein D3P07_01075 [Paenibacillus sp. 1011MAR3C5]
MSITSLIATNDKLKSLFAAISNLKESFIGMDGGDPFPSKPQIIVQREGRASPMIGHAYDYLLRAYVQRLNGIHEERENGDLAAVVAVNILDRKNIYEAYTGIVERRNAYITGESPITQAIVGDSIILGQLEQYYRSGTGDIPSILQSRDEDVHDLQRLIQATERHHQCFQATQGITCNPRFGQAITALVDGADGDLMIDNTLIDIKTESEFRWKIGQSRQLIAYWIMSCLSPGFTPEINHLALWNPRYCRMVSISVEDICRAFNVIDFVDSFIAIITADNFEGSAHLSPDQRKSHIQSVKETWNAADNPTRKLYR